MLLEAQTTHPFPQFLVVLAWHTLDQGQDDILGMNVKDAHDVMDVVEHVAAEASVGAAGNSHSRGIQVQEDQHLGSALVENCYLSQQKVLQTKPVSELILLVVHYFDCKVVCNYYLEYLYYLQLLQMMCCQQSCLIHQDQ